jgi:hypothetical protein
MIDAIAGYGILGLIAALVVFIGVLGIAEIAKS